MKEYLVHNFIADMHGPYFLFFYFGVITVIFFVCQYSPAYIESVGTIGNVQIPAKPDPYDISFLRGGAEETLKIILYNLLERGYVIASAKKYSLKQNKLHPPKENLTELELIVFNALYVSNTIESLFNGDIYAKVASKCKELEYQKDKYGFVFGKLQIAKFKKIKILALSLISLFGFYKISVAIYKGHHNLFYLVLLFIFGILSIIYLCDHPRLSKRGESFIEDLKTAFGTKNEKSLKGSAPYYELIQASIFGLGIVSSDFNFIKNYKEKSYERHHTRGSGGGSGGCGSCSSGSSSCGGGSCGGGCGGCGS